MIKIKKVIVGMFELREWCENNKEWLVALNINEAKNYYFPENTTRYDIRYILNMHEWDFSRLVVDNYGGKIYPWFGKKGLPLATFPDYWAAKKFVIEYVEPQLLMFKMSGELESRMSGGYNV